MSVELGHFKSLTYLKGFHTRYSVFVAGATSPFVRDWSIELDSTEIRFSPYTDSPGVMFLVTSMSSLPRAMKTPGNRVWGSC